MLGYTVDEVDNMINALEEAQLYFPPGKGAETLRANVAMAKDFLEGVISEGYVEDENE